MSEATGQRKLEVRVRGNRVFRITIPENWKVTFGGVNPSSGGYHGDGFALRIYEGKDNQRACFTGVQSFRDLSIPVEQLVRERKAEAKSATRKGRREESAFEEVTENWEALS